MIGAMGPVLGLTRASFRPQPPVAAASGAARSDCFVRSSGGVAEAPTIAVKSFRALAASIGDRLTAALARCVAPLVSGTVLMSAAPSADEVRADASMKLAKAISRFAGDKEAASIYDQLAASDVDVPTMKLLGEIAPKISGWHYEGTFHKLQDGVWSDCRDGKMPVAKESSLSSRYIVLDDWKDCTLEYKEGHSMYGDDSGALEISTDGKEWIPLQRFMHGHNFMTKVSDLSICDGQTVRFRFTTTRECDEGGLYVADFTVDGFNQRSGKREGLPLESLMRLMSVNDLLALATEKSISLDQRFDHLSVLHDVPNGWMERFLEVVHEKRVEGKMSEIDLRKLAGGAAIAVFGGSVDDALRRAARADAKVQVGEQDLVIGGIRIPKRVG